MNNTISFNGRICLTDYTGRGGVTKYFTTSKEQDNLIREAAEQIAPLYTLTVMAEDQVKTFHALLQQVTNSTIPLIKNEKGFYRTEDYITYADRFTKPWDGISLDIMF